MRSDIQSIVRAGAHRPALDRDNGTHPGVPRRGDGGVAPAGGTLVVELPYRLCWTRGEDLARLGTPIAGCAAGGLAAGGTLALRLGPPPEGR